MELGADSQENRIGLTFVNAKIYFMDNALGLILDSVEMAS